MTKDELFGISQSHIHWLSEHIGIHQEMVSPWLRMVKAAKLDGIDIEIVSGFRSFARQCSIWNRKCHGDLTTLDINNNHVDFAPLNIIEQVNAILLYSALPGASRHHWGTDVDVYSPSLLPAEQKLQLQDWEYQKDGPFYPLTCWLKEHAKHYGFYFPYDQSRGGIAAEPWHLSYYPLAKECMQNYSMQQLQLQLLESSVEHKQTIAENLAEIYQQFITNVGDF